MMIYIKIDDILIMIYLLFSIRIYLFISFLCIYRYLYYSMIISFVDIIAIIIHYSLGLSFNYLYSCL